jgi:predicted RNA binding protein YcfA (HicA-like mRNA interferase family)
MPKLPVLSAKDVIKVLTKSGFLVHRQTGVTFIYGIKTNDCLLQFQIIKNWLKER